MVTNVIIIKMSNPSSALETTCALETIPVRNMCREDPYVREARRRTDVCASSARSA